MKRPHGNFPPLHHSPTPNGPQSRAVPCWDPTYTKRSAHHKDLKSRGPKSKTPMTSPPSRPCFFLGFPLGISTSKMEPMDYELIWFHGVKVHTFSHPRNKVMDYCTIKKIPKIDTPPKTAKYLRTEAASEIPETCLFFFLNHLISKKISGAKIATLFTKFSYTNMDLQRKKTP